MQPLLGKITIVTGGSRGIGRSIAERLAQDGASVIVNYAQRADKAKEVVSTIEANGGKALAIQADIGQVADIRRLFKETIENFGKLDILVNNAAKLLKFRAIAEVSETEFDEQFGVNAKGTFFALQEAARHMANGGRIINISTVITDNDAPLGASVYTGSKAAVEQFTIGLAKELGERGITVNAVSPGTTETDSFKATAPYEVQAKAAQMSPLNRVGQPQDIADVVTFLAGDQARWITGQNIRVTGGAYL
jgi:3-oxoacyl-[acyl-carrier protein] reductase